MISLLIGIGYYLSPELTSLVRRSSRLLPHNINDGRLDDVFWLLIVITMANVEKDDNEACYSWIALIETNC